MRKPARKIQKTIQIPKAREVKGKVLADSQDVSFSHWVRRAITEEIRRANG